MNGIEDAHARSTARVNEMERERNGNQLTHLFHLSWIVFQFLWFGFLFGVSTVFPWRVQSLHPKCASCLLSFRSFKNNNKIIAQCGEQQNTTSVIAAHRDHESSILFYKIVYNVSFNLRPTIFGFFSILVSLSPFLPSTLALRRTHVDRVFVSYVNRHLLLLLLPFDFVLAFDDDVVLESHPFHSWIHLYTISFGMLSFRRFLFPSLLFYN